ncbi:MAG: MFS transporter, partial [Microbacterium sp.]
ADSGIVFLINAVTFFAMLTALLSMRKDELNPRTKRKGAAKLSAGFRYVKSRPDLIVCFIMVFLVGAFGMNFPIFASTMALEFGHQADGYGLLSSIVAIGSLVGALLSARRERARMRVVMIAAGGFGVASMVSSFMPSYASYAVVLVLVGLGTVTMLTTANGYVQTTSDPVVRGRVMALYMAVVMGSTPIGAPIAGAVADALGPRSAIRLGAIAGMLACVIGIVWTLRSGRLHRSEEHRFALSFDETRPIEVITTANPALTGDQYSDQIAQTNAIRLPRPDDSEEIPDSSAPSP